MVGKGRCPSKVGRSGSEGEMDITKKKRKKKE
jgi:hypothetical protein